MITMKRPTKCRCRQVHEVACVRPVLLRAIVALCLLASLPARAAGKPVMFEDMDYGPAMAYTIQADWPKHNGNITYKGLAIQLDGGKAGVLFDMDLMRVAAAWINDTDKPYLDLSRTNLTSYKGGGLAMPRGTKVFGTKVGPGWSVGPKADFDDPREAKYGVLPKDHARFEGYHVQGDRVVLAYRVGGVRVLESPRVVSVKGVRVFVRDMRIDPTEQPLTVRLFDQPDSEATLSVRKATTCCTASV